MPFCRSFHLSGLFPHSVRTVLSRRDATCLGPDPVFPQSLRWLPNSMACAPKIWEKANHHCPRLNWCHLRVRLAPNLVQVRIDMKSRSSPYTSPEVLSFKRRRRLNSSSINHLEKLFLFLFLEDFSLNRVPVRQPTIFRASQKMAHGIRILDFPQIFSAIFDLWAYKFQHKQEVWLRSSCCPKSSG